MKKDVKNLTEYFHHFWDYLKCKTYSKLLAPSFYSIGEKTLINPPLRFGNLSQMQLGKKVVIQSNCWITVLNINAQDKSTKLIIKDYVSIGMNATISAAKKIEIEEYVFTARNVYISDHGHEFRDVARPIALQGIGNVAEVRIGAYTWLGQNSVVLPGVTIGKHCVIGANSVVNKDIPDYSVAVGVPVKVVKRYNENTSIWERV